jgi:hypothetical protein
MHFNESLAQKAAAYMGSYKTCQFLYLVRRVYNTKKKNIDVREQGPEKRAHYSPKRQDVIL